MITNTIKIIMRMRGLTKDHDTVQADGLEGKTKKRISKLNGYISGEEPVDFEFFVLFRTL